MESHPSARRRGPQAGAGQANGAALLSFGWTISDNRQLCQPEVGFQAGLDTGSAEATVRSFTSTHPYGVIPAARKVPDRYTPSVPASSGLPSLVERQAGHRHFESRE